MVKCPLRHPVDSVSLDEPDSNPSCVPLYFLANLAAQQVRVVQSGEGADELFAGYAAYGFTQTLKRCAFLPKD